MVASIIIAQNSTSPRSQGLASSRPRPRLRPGVFEARPRPQNVFEVSSRSRPVLEDPIPAFQTGLMTQPQVSKHRMNVVSHPHSYQSHQACLSVLKYAHASISQENTNTNLSNTSKHSESTQWREAKSGRPNLWAAQMIVQLWNTTQ